MPSETDWKKIDDEKTKLRLEELAAQKAQEELWARLVRIRKQREFLENREQRLIAAGLHSMDELDALEELERKDREENELLKQGKETALPLPDGAEVANLEGWDIDSGVREESLDAAFDPFVAFPSGHSFWDVPDAVRENSQASRGT